MKLHNTFVVPVALLAFISTPSFADSAYRKCMKNEMKRQIALFKCDFSKLNAARSSANSKCGPLIIDEVEVGSEDFQSKIDILKRSGNGDIDDLANQQADKCGVKLTIQGDRVTTTAVAK